MPLYAKLDCAFPADPKVVEAGCLAELLYIRAVLHCREHLTDGVVDKRLLPRIALGIRGKPSELARKLVAAGLWTEHETGWEFPPHVWQAWNPTKAEVEEMAAEKGKAGSLGNHERWHVAKGVRSHMCRYCIADRSHGAIVCDSGANRKTSLQPESPVSVREEPLASAPPNAGRKARSDTPRSTPAVKEPDAIWDALMAVCGVEGNPTPSARGAYNRAAGELRAVDATPEEIQARAGAYRARFPDATLTPSALARHWPELNGHVKVNTSAGPARPREFFVATDEPIDHAGALEQLRAIRGQT